MTKKQGAVRPRSGQNRTLKYRVLDWMTTVVIGVGAAALLLFGVFSPMRVESATMSGVEKGDVVVADRLGKYLYGFDRGDMLLLKPVEFEINKNTDKKAEPLRLARVVAFAGETVTISGGSVYINGSLLDETEYARALYTSIRMEFTVPSGSVFVLPDERLYLTDEMLEELVVDTNRIKGEVRFIAYPFARMAAFK